MIFHFALSLPKTYRCPTCWFFWAISLLGIHCIFTRDRLIFGFHWNIMKYWYRPFGRFYQPQWVLTKCCYIPHTSRKLA